MTGGQDHPATGRTLSGEETVRLDFVALGKAIGIPRVEKINAYHLDKIRYILREAFRDSHPSLIIVEAPCQLKKREKSHPMVVEDMFCLLCGLCASIGCPAIEKGDTIRIAPERCAGCRVCATICPFQAIEEVKTP
jgi:indolepyruvate ferredoxin oxidoreductase alpha subunit